MLSEKIDVVLQLTTVVIQQKLFLARNITFFGKENEMTHVTKYFGPPGTGKTSRLINIVGQELEAGLSPAQIVYVSFTKIAAKVAAQRARDRFPWYPESEFNYFATVHSICFNLLGLHKSVVFSDKEKKNFGEAYKYEFAIPEVAAEDPFQQAIQDMAIVTRADFLESLYNYWRNSCLPVDDAILASATMGAPDDFEPDEFRVYIARRNEYKKENSLYDYPDMLSEVLERELFPRSMKVLIADEYQDNSLLLDRVLQSWLRRAQRVYVAGDPYQCLYSWSSADPKLFIDFAADQTMTLKQSYRCPKAVHQLSRRIVSRFQTRYEDDDYLPTDEPGLVTRRIDFDLTSDSTFWLFRTRYLLSQTFDDLYFKGIPFLARRGKRNIFDHKRDKKRRIVSRLLSMPYETITLYDLAQVIEYLPSTVKERGIVLIERGMKQYIKEEAHEQPDARVSWQNLADLGFTSEFLQYRDGNLLELLKPKEFSDAEKSYIRRVVERHGRTVMERRPKLELGTFHSVKGDEAARVIIDPTYTKKPYFSFVNGNEEEHRLIYTGITRSSREVVVLPPSGWMAYPVM